MRTTPMQVAGHVGRADVEGCLHASGFSNVPSDDGAVVACVAERYPAGDLGACLDSLADLPAASPSPSDSAAAAAASASPSAAEPGAPAAGAAAPVESAAPVEAAPQTIVTETQGELPWWPLGVAFLLGGAMAAAITYFAVRSEAAPHEEIEAPHVVESLPPTVAIATPRDLSVQPCGMPIALSSNAVPPERAGDVSWSVTAPDNREIASGSGAQFTFVGTATGVYHVVARLDKAADDLLLFLFKTPSGGTTLTDLLESEEPATPREPTGYVWHRHRKL
jgi:hypothetical protein